MDNFDLKKKLGRGGFGTVWLAKNLEKNKYCAVKIYKENMEDYKKNKVEKSFKIAQKLSHPNLMRCYDLFIDRMVLEENYIRGKSTVHTVLIMEYIKGKELDKVSNLDMKIEKYLSQILKGIQYLHENKIVHRDIKPENILVREDERVKLIDFDLFKINHSNIVNINKAGTPFYFSPEIWEKKGYSYETDLWSLGITLYRSLKKEFPFLAEDKEELKNLVLSDYEPDFKNFSEKIEKIIRGLLVKDSKKRLKINEIFEYLKN
jgi:serine/threonine protein kinase